MLNYYDGNLEQTEAILSQTIQKEMPQNNYQKSKNAVWLLLDRATTRFAMGDTCQAIEDYQSAIEAMDYYSQNSVGETAGKILIQDDVEAYTGEDFEQVLARVYFALALIQNNDLSNAHALLRQAEELQQKKKEEYGKLRYTQHYQLIDNSLGKYLFATLLEKRGDLSNANILYKQTQSLVGDESFEATLSPDKTKNSATVLILCHNGNSPRKVSIVTNASVASTVALEFFLSSSRYDPAWSCLTGIPVPKFVQGPFSDPKPTFSILDGCEKELEPWYDISQTAVDQLEQKTPAIAARGVARYVLRRGAIGVAQRQDPTLGCLVDAAMFVANVCTEADTRSWTTLPSAIDLARYDVQPGCHKLAISVDNRPGRSFHQELNLELKPNDLCVVNVFNIYPGVTPRVVHNGEFR